MITKTLWSLECKNANGKPLNHNKVGFNTKCTSPYHCWVSVCSNIEYDMPSFHHFDYLWVPDISEHKNQVRCNMRNGKAWWVEAGADDQTPSLSGCPVTEVYSKGMCEKEDRISQENLHCHSTWPNKGFLTPPTHGPMAKDSEEHLELMIGKSPKRISEKNLPNSSTNARPGDWSQANCQIRWRARNAGSRTSLTMDFSQVTDHPTAYESQSCKFGSAHFMSDDQCSATAIV